MISFFGKDVWETTYRSRCDRFEKTTVSCYTRTSFNRSFSLWKLRLLCILYLRI